MPDPAPTETRIANARKAGAPWIRRLATKRQLRKAGMSVPQAALLDLRALRALRRTAS